MSSRVILVTGSNTGIGFELVRLLAQKGHIVYLASRNEAAGKEAQQKLKADNLDVKVVRLDVTDLESIKAAKDVIEKNEGRLDVLVNNAGAAFMDQNQNAPTVSLDTIRAAFEPNFYGLIQTTQIMLPLLRKSSLPVIVNVATGMASNTYMSTSNILHFVAYNTSKVAANSYMISLAHELKSEGFKINAVTPGFTSTKLNFFSEGGKTPRQGAESILPWALVDKDGPTGQYFNDKGGVMPW